VIAYDTVEFPMLSFTLIRFLQEGSCLRLRRMN
jgi:hypothetical protein